MARNQDQILQGLLAGVPPGWAWPRDPSSAGGKLLRAPAEEFARLEAGMEALLEEADPRTTNGMLADWERAFGLPDPCMPLNATIEQRRAALLAHITAQGGQSIAYFTEVAAALGYTVTIEEFRPFRFGSGRFGTPIYGEAWAFAWRVRAPETTVTPFRFGRSAFGEPLRAWGNEQLECVLTRLKPAHTVLIFAYGS